LSRFAHLWQPILAIRSIQGSEWYSGAAFHSSEEGDLKKSIVLVIGGLAFLAGCGPGDKAANIPATPKWKGAPYRIAFDTKAAKPNPAGVALPPINYTANPEGLETRASLVVRFDASDASGKKKDQPLMDQIIVGPFDISGAEGAVPADNMDLADKGLARLLTAYCMKGKVKVTVALARSSLSPQAADAEVTSKRLSDWLPIEIAFKNPHPKC
jgi:hypothetical protein